MGYNRHHLVLRGTTWHFYRRVPKSVAHLDSRPHVKRSLGTDSEKVAIRRAEIVNQALEDYWSNLARAGYGTAKEKYEAAIRVALSLGYEYRPAEELAGGPIADILDRLDAIEANGAPNGTVVAALLGGAEKPPLTLSSALEEYWDLSADETRNKTDRQKRRWENPRRKAVANFIDLIADKKIEDITRADALEFRRWWLERVVDESLTANAANKDIGALSKIFRVVNDALRLELENPFSNLRLSERDDRSKRYPFEPAFVQSVLLDPERLEGLNLEGRMLLYAMADTGCGFTELTSLDPDEHEIRLDAPTPFIRITRNRYSGLKVRYRERDIPLVGAALYALRQCPDGFPSYRGKPDSASSTVNKFLRENGLTPSEHHSAYSLRHTFEDRMTAIEVPERIAAALMGHKFQRPMYGQGPSLEQKAEWLRKIAFIPPALSSLAFPR